MVGTISGVSPIGRCQVEQINRNKVTITPGNEEGMDFGISIEFLPDPEIAISGGELSLDWGWAPQTLEIFSDEGISLVLERSANPFRVVIPKRTEGYDPRKLTINASWNSGLKQKLLDLDRDGLSFNVLSEVSESEYIPLIFDFGRGMRNDGSPSLISNVITVNSQLYTPISPLEGRSIESFRRYPDGSIHVDKMGPYSLTHPLKDTSVSQPLLNFSKMDVESWGGVFRSEDGLLHSSVIMNGMEFSGPSFHSCFFELLSLISSSIEDNSSENQEAIVNIVENVIGLMDEDGLWRYQYPLEIYGETVEKGWFSSLSQSTGAMGLIRAGEYLGDTTLKKHAEKAMNLMFTSDDLVYDFNGWRIFRHHSGKNPSCILSTHLYSLMAISDLTEVRGTKKWKKILDTAIRDTELILPLYDTGISTHYDLSHILNGQPSVNSSPQYHCTHTMQLLWLSEKISSTRISEIAKTWKSYIF